MSDIWENFEQGFATYWSYDICEEKINRATASTKKSDRTIYKRIWSKNLIKKDLNPTDLDFWEQIRFIINGRLCLYYRRLWNEWKKLWNNKKIFPSFTVNGTVWWKLERDYPDNLFPIFILKKILVYSYLVFTYIYFYCSIVFYCCGQVQFGFLSELSRKLPTPIVCGLFSSYCHCFFTNV